MTGIGPTIGTPQPGFGLRVRLDHKRALASGDFNCRCGELAEDAVGHDEVRQMAVRAERHMRDECPLEEVRAAAAMRDHRRKNPRKKRK
ncbi:hypothetical protein OIU91_28510 [Streptomyces sp. NBC_01456]|uniref:hypothetical protein n=1 Tax=unclassified Streptomyces TaxID=2593676 RepID=UPI002E377208|nr:MULTISPECIES: hypothetical protein [unclassified Streptomyces]